jgi:hypothetical protein
MDITTSVQAAAPTPETTVQAAEPTYAIQDTPGGRKLVRVEPETKVELKAEPAAEPAAVPQTEPKAESAAPAPVQEPPKTDTTPDPEPPNDAPYTAEELAEAPDVSKLDPKRIPEALQPVYKNIIRGMNRKFQELAAEKKVLSEMADALKKPEPQLQQPNPKDFYAQRHNFIKAKVEEIFQGEEYNPFAFPEHQLAYNDIEFKLKSLEQQKQADQAQAQAQTHGQKVAAVVEELQAQPDWQDVLNFAHDNLPAKEWEAGDELLKSGDKEKVMAKYKEWRDKFYGVSKPAAPKPAKPKPPVLETGGKGAEPTPQNVPLNGEFLSKFRNANPQDKIKMISQWRKSQGG